MRLVIDVNKIRYYKTAARGINDLQLSWCEDNPPKVLTKLKRDRVVDSFMKHFGISKQEARWLTFWCCTLFSLNSPARYTIQGGQDSDYAQGASLHAWFFSTVGRMERLGCIDDIVRG